MAIRIERTESNGRYLAKVWHGKRRDPTFYYSYRTEEQRDAFISECEKNDADRDLAKAEAKERKTREVADMRARVEVGTVFHYSWGYEQTQCEFYEVTKKSKSGASVTVRRILAKTVPGSEYHDADRRVPSRGSFVDGSEPKKKVITAYGISFPHGCGSIVSPGETFHCSWGY